MAEQQKQKDIWSADLYGEKVAPFVATSTEKVLAWLDPKPTGIDGSPNMIEHFKKAYPHIESRVVDCRWLDQEPGLTNGSFNKVFSNAALHWILRDPETRSNTIKGCFKALKPGGLLVNESGALGNVAEVHSAIISGLVTQGIPVTQARKASPWWFPSLQAMKDLVEGAGFTWVKGEVQLRQTTLTENEKGGVEGWIRLFGEPFLELLPTTQARDAAIKHAVDVLEAVGRQQHDGSFTVNYIRLRFVAQKPE
ncbi:S-adenosyl-L-methionine-dependent methyltransferase [Penicillium waksmanii]|uniref:S-adenosyl-L-methionine-dependent methyltransferase n=1 Tax=Penicillium waksmanii TaxID=69791 RepID=UPI0025490C31|nr:S-adenosyl-L-methionine-dependent methyltransferase [Penicillium waksmanii]KAJ6001184.1 S-adenosyl-L-methionine-dependent methyltransferase [Penicillium waksmanii]